VTTIEQEIATWAATRPSWQRAALRQLAQGHVFIQTEIEAIAAELKAGKQRTTTALKASEVPGAQSAGATVSLRSIRDATNVNALLESQELTFGPVGLTVVYGDNGSGKSGYARLIKTAVGARHQEPVHVDVFADTAGQPQKALVAFASAGIDKISSWPNAVSADLKAVSFYDEACGDAYIGGDSELTYRPSALLMLDGLIALCDGVGAVLGEELRQNQLARGPMPSVSEDTDAARFLSALSGTTTDAELDAASSVAADASERLGALLQEEARLLSTDPSKERSRLETLAGKVNAIATHAAAIAEALSDEKAQEAKTAYDTAVELRAAATVASSGTFEAEPVPGVGTETWRALWEAARRFSEVQAYHDRHFPVTSEDARCVLCQQALSAEASRRLDQFHAFMQDTTAQQAAAAEQALERATSTYRLLEPTPPQIAAQLVEVEASDSALAQAVTGWLQSAAARRTALLAFLGGATDRAIPPLDPSPQVSLDERVTTLRAAAESIDATQFQRSLADTVAEKKNLEARLAIGRQRADIRAEITRLAEKAALDAAKHLTDTTGITRKSTDLTDAHVTSLVRDRFTRESDRLHLERIELKKTGGQKGKLRHRPSLLGAKTPKPVAQVLSEGEQTALGLAGYFTEAHFDDSRSALVLDDPVTSLDHVRRSRVAHRLAELATNRQVIVFTHDVAFVADLRRAADEHQAKFTERGVQRRGDKAPGLCTDQHPWKVKDVPRRLHDLAQALASITRNRASWDQDTYDKECSDWAGKLSETWERLINLEIVYTVVDPGTSYVNPKMFKVLARITEEDNREFQQSYGRISGWARRHDKSPGSNYVAPDPDELEKELDFVKAWYERIKKYRS
jgi:energy-coupling factor transporter ATP-binding protein EcfA2